MEPSKGGGDGFEFGFNNAKFSDRILRIEILPDPPKAKSGNRTCGEGIRTPRCLLQSILFENSWLFTLCSPRSELFSADDKTDQNHDEESSSSSAHPAILKVKTVHISSIILARSSPFFYKMFSNGMRESEQEKVTLQIYASEEPALMDLLQFTYSKKLTADKPTALLDVLMLADKYEITSCITKCGKLLQKVPMNCELALSCMDLPSSVLAVEGVSQLFAEAKIYLAKVSKNITMYEEEAMKLPLDRVKDALSSDELKVATEDDVYDFVIKWVATHFPESYYRQEVLKSHLCQCVRFPHLSCDKLREVLTCCDLDPKVASMIVLEALFFKAERLDLQRALIDAKIHTTHEFSYRERAYNHHPAKVIEFDSPLLQSIVHLDLKREDVEQMGQIRSQDFYVGSNQFHLNISRNGNESAGYFGIYLFREVKNQPEVCPVTVQYEFAVRQKTNGKFKTKKSGKYTFVGNDSCGVFDLFDITWNAFMSSQYFINDTLYLRADVTTEKLQVPPKIAHPLRLFKGNDPGDR